MNLKIPAPNAKQKLFLKDTHRRVGYGGARGGGKSWAVRTKAVIMAGAHPGIRQLIVRKTYPELYENHINVMRPMLTGMAKYSDKEKRLTFINGSTIKFMYCQYDRDLDKLQGQEYDIIYFDEATQLTEYQMKTIDATCRGANDFPKRTYYTCNPGGVGHAYIKRIFIERRYEENENPEEYSFIQALPTDNRILMEKDPGYVKTLEALPPKLRKAWLEGSWDIFEGQFFEEFQDNPEHYDDRKWTHIINPFEIPAGWKIYRSYDFGYSKPFSCGWWAVDYDGVIYRILELYGWNGTPNEGLKWDAHQQFAKIHEVETTHPLLRGRHITGVADPAIWNKETGESIEEVATKHQVYFSKGDNARIPGWMQIHYRMTFDKNGYPMMYAFNTCKNFIRTMPLQVYSETVPEDLDTDMEDHIPDEVRYFCMSRPISPRTKEVYEPIRDDPLDMVADMRRRASIRR